VVQLGALDCGGYFTVATVARMLDAKHEVVPTAAPTTAVETAQGVTFASELKDGHVTLTGVVKDQATKDAMVQAATAQYGRIM